MEWLEPQEKARRHTVRMLEWGSDTLPSYLCPSCGRDAQFKHVGGPYPGLECGNCHQFHADFSWEVSAGKLVKKHPHIPRTSYVDKQALSSTNTVKRGIPAFQTNGGFSEDRLAIEEAIEEMSI